MQGTDNIGKIACMSELTSLKKDLQSSIRKMTRLNQNDEAKRLPAYQPDEVEKDLAYMINQNYEERKRPACSSGEDPSQCTGQQPAGPCLRTLDSTPTW